MYHDCHAAGGFARCRWVNICRCGFAGQPVQGCRYFRGLALDVIFNVRLFTYRGLR